MKIKYLPFNRYWDKEYNLIPSIKQFPLVLEMMLQESQDYEVNITSSDNNYITFELNTQRSSSPTVKPQAIDPDWAYQPCGEGYWKIDEVTHFSSFSNTGKELYYKGIVFIDRRKVGWPKWDESSVHFESSHNRRECCVFARVPSPDPDSSDYETLHNHRLYSSNSDIFYADEPNIFNLFPYHKYEDFRKHIDRGMKYYPQVFYHRTYGKGNLKEEYRFHVKHWHVLYGSLKKWAWGRKEFSVKTLSLPEFDYQQFPLLNPDWIPIKKSKLITREISIYEILSFTYENDVYTPDHDFQVDLLKINNEDYYIVNHPPVNANLEHVRQQFENSLQLKKLDSTNEYYHYRLDNKPSIYYYQITDIGHEDLSNWWAIKNIDNIGVKERKIKRIEILLSLTWVIKLDDFEDGLKTERYIFKAANQYPFKEIISISEWEKIREELKLQFLRIKDPRSIWKELYGWKFSCYYLDGIYYIREVLLRGQIKYTIPIGGKPPLPKEPPKGSIPLPTEPDYSDILDNPNLLINFYWYIYNSWYKTDSWRKISNTQFEITITLDKFSNFYFTFMNSAVSGQLEYKPYLLPGDSKKSNLALQNFSNICQCPQTYQNDLNSIFLLPAEVNQIFKLKLYRLEFIKPIVDWSPSVNLSEYIRFVNVLRLPDKKGEEVPAQSFYVWLPEYIKQPEKNMWNKWENISYKQFNYYGGNKSLNLEELINTLKTYNNHALDHILINILWNNQVINTINLRKLDIHKTFRLEMWTTVGSTLFVINFGEKLVRIKENYHYYVDKDKWAKFADNAIKQGIMGGATGLAIGMHGGGPAAIAGALIGVAGGIGASIADTYAQPMYQEFNFTSGDILLNEVPFPRLALQLVMSSHLLEWIEYNSIQKGIPVYEYFQSSNFGKELALVNHRCSFYKIDIDYSAGDVDEFFKNIFLKGVFMYNSLEKIYSLADSENKTKNILNKLRKRW